MITTNLTFFNTDMSGYLISNASYFPSHLTNFAASGAFKPAINNNIYNRKGLDFSVTAQEHFGYVHASLGVVGTILDTKFSKVDELYDYDYQKDEGRPLDGIWAFNCLGFYNLDDFDVTTSDDGKTKYTLKKGVPNSTLGGTIQPGDLKYEDTNNDGVINSKDAVCLGKSGAFGSPVTLGLNLTLKYKNFTLFAVADGQFGAYGMRNTPYYCAFGDYKYSTAVLGRWTPETADVATHPRLSTQNMYHNITGSTFWMYSTDRLDLRKVQITYDFPQEMFKGKVVKALSVYMNGNNLLTISKWRNLMETNIGYAPQTRFYNLGVKVTL